VTPVVGPLFGSTGYLVLGVVPPMFLLFAIDQVLNGERVAHLVAGTLGVLVFALVLRVTVMVIAHKDGVSVVWRVSGQSRTVPWNDIERLEGSRFRARLVLRDGKTRKTIAGFDPHWADRRVMQVITEHITPVVETSTD